MLCGVFRAVLVLPEAAEPDEKVILHELLHLRYRDTAQNVFWCLLRSLHWCNPFLWYVFDRIQNDMESLCDQRVLERLEGEERREYGRLLLSMADSRYDRLPGTSSISNGGRNIRRRIEAIVRFRKYPRGMALVSGCILAVLGTSLLLGSESAYGAEKFSVISDLSLARTRVQRCTTLAGALDTYAKALMLRNGYYLATASPLSHQEELAERIPEGCEILLPDIPDLSVDAYQVVNLTEDQNGGYRALLVFYTPVPGDDLYDTAAVPVRVWQEDGWVVEEDGGWLTSTGSHWYGSSSLPFLAGYAAEGETGTVTARCRTILSVDNTSSDRLVFITAATFDSSLKPDALFQKTRRETELVYTLREGLEGPARSIGLQAAPLSSPDETWEFHNKTLMGSGGGGSSNGEYWVNGSLPENWDGMQSLRLYDTVESDGPVTPPAAYRVQVFWDGQPQEELTVRGGVQNEE